MKDLKLYFEERRKKTSSGEYLIRDESIDIDFNKFLYKEYAEFQVSFKNPYYDNYKIDIGVCMCYNVGTLEQFKMTSKECDIYHDVYDDILTRNRIKQLDAELNEDYHLVEKDDLKRIGCVS